MRLFPLAYAAALLPLFAIHLCYVVAAAAGHVDWCFPYLHSCTSISATGRKPPEFFLFKALMLPAAVLIAAYWMLACEWLLQLGCTARRRRRVVWTMGAAGAVGLILYCVMLGAIGEAYQLQRRIGVTAFFGFSYLGHLLLTWLLYQIDAVCRVHARWLSVLLYLGLLMLGVGLLSIALGAAMPQRYDRMEDAFEWIFVLLLCLYVLAVGELWRRTDFRADLSVRR